MLQEQYKTLESEHAFLKTTYENSRDEFYKNKVELSSYEERTKDLILQIEDINNQITRLNVRLEKDNEKIIEEKDALENIAIEIEKLGEGNKEIANTLNDKKDVLGLVKDELEEVMKTISKNDNLIKSLGKKMAQADKNVAQTEVKLTQYIDEEESIDEDASIDEEEREEGEAALKLNDPIVLNLMGPEMEDASGSYFMSGAIRSAFAEGRLYMKVFADLLPVTGATQLLQ